MFVSDAKREANRRNALKSTGPKTEEGKDRSRRNAIKHGLTSLVVVPEDAETLQAEADTLFWSLKPQNGYQRDLLSDAALFNIRINRAQRIERRLRDQAALRAMTSWDDDRRLEAERLALDLPDRPAEVLAGLCATHQGCDWLIERWAMLAHVADSGVAWTEDQRRLAFDLLGTPAEFRAGKPGVTLDPDGRVLDRGDDPAAIARAQIASIRACREVAAEHDEVDRALAEADLTDEPTAEIRRLRRHEAALHKRLRWTMDRFRDPIPTHRPNLNLRPDFHRKPEAEAEELAEAQAELDAKAERDLKFEAEYYAKAREREEAKARDEAKALARKEARARRRDEAIARARNEAKAGGQNEAKAAESSPSAPAEGPEEADSGPERGPTAVYPVVAGDPADRREARDRKAEARRQAKRRKLDRRRA